MASLQLSGKVLVARKCRTQTQRAKTVKVVANSSKSSKPAKIGAALGSSLILGGSSAALALDMPAVDAGGFVSNLTSNPQQALLLVAPIVLYGVFNVVRDNMGGEDAGEEAASDDAPAAAEEVEVEVEAKSD